MYGFHAAVLYSVFHTNKNQQVLHILQKPITIHYFRTHVCGASVLPDSSIRHVVITEL
jgi:hypothetical protein